jgi:hypothetical protein
MASTIDKVKHALHLDHKGTSTSHTHTGTSEGVAGPHSSRVGNAADPTVDSDLDGSRNAGAAQHNTTHSALGNNQAGITGNGHSHTTTGNNQTGITGNGHSHTTTGQNSSLAAKLNPADHTTGIGARDGTQFGNSTGNQHTGTVGGISGSTNAGPHQSNLANAADPRVDSDLSNTGNRHGAATGGVLGAHGSHATPGSGTAQNTAGPHNSDKLNQLDPRVDADLDGSKTYGGNKTHQ